jgi:hypothetical protein
MEATRTRASEPIFLTTFFLKKFRDYEPAANPPRCATVSRRYL